ncbi:hypothetical protein PYCC9005_002370 [Savitreella phatthalungensis]
MSSNAHEFHIVVAAWTTSTFDPAINHAFAVTVSTSPLVAIVAAGNSVEAPIPQQHLHSRPPPSQQVDTSADQPIVEEDDPYNRVMPGVDASTVSPASADGVITVGSSDIEDRWAAWCNYGPAITVIAPGVDVAAPRLIHQIETTADMTVSHEFELVNGSSVSTGIVAGAFGRTAAIYGPRQGAWNVEAIKRSFLANRERYSIAGVPAGTSNKFVRIVD